MKSMYNTDLLGVLFPFYTKIPFRTLKSVISEYRLVIKREVFRKNVERGIGNGICFNKKRTQ